MRFLVFIPLGHTIVHFPQSMQHRIISRMSLPLCTASSILLTDIPESLPAGQVALHDPHPMHSRAPLSSLHNCAKRASSTFPRSRVELRLSVNPKSVIVRQGMNGCIEQRFWLLPLSRALSWVPCRPLRRISPGGLIPRLRIRCPDF